MDRANDYGNFVYVPTEHDQRKERLFLAGWEWVPDTNHPKMKEMLIYDQMISLHAIGWYIKQGHPLKSRLVGDSRPRWVAAETVERVYID
jgi:hypothetical protein